jgi:transposase
MNVFAARAAELAEARPELAAAVEPLLKAPEAVERQIADLDRKVLRLVRNDAQVRRFMAAPGVGPITFTRQAGRKTGGNPDPGGWRFDSGPERYNF